MKANCVAIIPAPINHLVEVSTKAKNRFAVRTRKMPQPRPGKALG